MLWLPWQQSARSVNVDNGIAAGNINVVVAMATVGL